MNATPTLQDIASCVSGYDPNALPVAQAQEFIARLVPRVQAVEMLPIRSALGRVLARDIVSPINVPAHDNSAMDGYALRGADLSASADTVLQSAGTGFAGQQFDGDVGPGQCVRIMTGAVMPAGLDTVVPQEFVKLDGDKVRIPAGIVQTGDNRRFAGEDLGCCAQPIWACSLRSARPRCRCYGACALLSSRPAMNFVRSASRSMRAACTTATATHSGACCSGSVSRCSTSAWCATTRLRSKPPSAMPRRMPMR
jgi:MoeA N-terminal region (domain I and II)